MAKIEKRKFLNKMKKKRNIETVTTDKVDYLLVNCFKQIVLSKIKYEKKEENKFCKIVSSFSYFFFFSYLFCNGQKLHIYIHTCIHTIPSVELLYITQLRRGNKKV